MEPEDYIEDHDEQLPQYREPGEISAMELGQALCSLYLLGEDAFLRMQAFNLSLVDHFIMGLEVQLRQQQFDETAIPGAAAFLSAQTQMWLFAVYELLRTCRSRATDVLKLAQNGGLALKAAALERELPFAHPTRLTRAAQLRHIIAEPALLDRIRADLRRTHISFKQLEHVRVALAKHEVSGKPKGVPHGPGIFSFNHWSGSLQFEIGYEGVILGTLDRRNLAEALRSLSNGSEPPTDEELADFDQFMRGLPADFWDEPDGDSGKPP